MLDGLPDGWRLAFQDAMCREIQKEYLKLEEELRKDFYIIQAKEKFGSMRIYFSYACDSIEDIVERYSIKSERLCVACGAPADFISKGWISPWCFRHAERDRGEYVTVNEWFNDGK